MQKASLDAAESMIEMLAKYNTTKTRRWSRDKADLEHSTMQALGIALIS